MMALDDFFEATAIWPRARVENGKLLVPTQCLYPSNDIVMVTIEGGCAAFKVHDGARTVDEALASISSAFISLRSARHLACRQGLIVTDDWVIQSPLVTRENLAGVIALVANTAKEIAHQMIDRARPKPLRDIKEALATILDRTFPHEWNEEERIAGQSTKQHRFDLVVRLKGERKLLLDAVRPEPTAINSVVVSHLDVRSAHFPNVEQRIVYDDEYPWKSSDLFLLSVCATPIPLSHANDVLSRLAT